MAGLFYRPVSRGNRLDRRSHTMRDPRYCVTEEAFMAIFSVERLDHLGIVAGVCQEMGLVEYFDDLDDHVHGRVILGQAVLAMALNGLGFSNRRLYLSRSPLESGTGSAEEAPERRARAWRWR